MSQEISFSKSSKPFPGWIGIVTIVLLYAAMYAANFWFPLIKSDLTSRIWNWSQNALTIAAFVALIWNRQYLRLTTVLLGLGLATLSALSHWLHDPSLSWSLQEGIAVGVCFLSAVVLFCDLKAFQIPAFQPPLAGIARSLFLGMMVAIPLAILNNLYFYMTNGSVQFQNVLFSAFEALSPAIHEEIVFRFFVLALCLNLLRFSTSHRLAIIISVFLAVVPHSLNHLPDLFTQNPGMGFILLSLTSLLFGLPMAFLQVRRNLETAIAFHWFIDFARFLFGF